MKYEKEFQFFLNLMKNLDLPVRIFPTASETELKRDLDIYSLVYPNFSYDQIFEKMIQLCEPACIYHIYDNMLCNYLIFLLPETAQPSYVIVGPYLELQVSRQEILANAERMSIAPSHYPHLEDFYIHVPLVADVNNLLAIINTLGEVLWGDLSRFTWKNLHAEQELLFPYTFEDDSAEYEEPAAVTRRLEENYQLENEFLNAVVHGQSHKAEMLMKDYSISRIEQRVSDSMRNIKNYSIVLNTLLRKAAEQGGVHPIHINQLSSSYARKIETLTSNEAALHLHREMVHKYSLLVKNHSLQNYSPLIRKVITNVDADLTSDLSLKAQAKLLNINASYLSNLFRKEMNLTLTEYVNRRRIEYAVTLLNSTNMQIQLIAQYCGFTDVNYFTKTFKKFIEMTPQEYRRHISLPAPLKKV